MEVSVCSVIETLGAGQMTAGSVAAENAAGWGANMLSRSNTGISTCQPFLLAFFMVEKVKFENAMTGDGRVPEGHAESGSPAAGRQRATSVEPVWRCCIGKTPLVSGASDETTVL